MQRLSLSIIILLSFILVACGGEIESESAAPQSYNLSWEFTNEFSYSPDNVGVPAGSTITVDLDNSAASVAHSWVLVKAGLLEDSATPEEIELAAVSDRANSGEVTGGEKKQFVFKAPSETGEYEYICSVAGHLAGGMRGSFSVTE